jgi:membrane protease YdiL (CAAX protease family)
VTSIPPPGYGLIEDEPRAEPQWPAPAPPARPAGSAGWRPWTAWVALITAFGVAIVGGAAIAIIAAAGGASLEEPPAGVTLGGTFLQDFAMIGAALLFASFAGRPSGADFGLSRPQVGRAVRLALGVWFAFFAFSWIWSVALGLDEEQTLPDALGIDESSLQLALVIVLITVMAPLGEELLFRGYVFGALRNWKGWLPAAVITGLVFGSIHIGSAPVGYLVPLAFFGFGLCVLYQRTGSLYPCIGLHALNNSVALGILQKWTAGEVALLMLGALVASLLCARLLAGVLGDRALPAGPPLAPPAAQ